MRRTVPTVIIAVLALAACGSSESTDDTTVVTNASNASTPVDTSADGSTSTATSSVDSVVDGSIPTETLPPNPDKPDVALPAEIPSELVRTVLEDGTGEGAIDGDTVIVDYVGVRSVDGVEFDNSYDRQQPFPVTVGSGGVIQGWDEGLVGSKNGERIQLDIPAELAYGAEARGEIIRANEALSFVIDVRAVVKPVDPADEPTEPGVPFSEGATETTFEDIVVGDGDPLEIGQTAVVRYVNFRGDNGVVIESNWTSDPLQLTFGENLLPGLLIGMEGMNVGGQRAITIPPADGFGEEGSPQAGLPAGTDMIMLVELVGAF